MHIYATGKAAYVAKISVSNNRRSRARSGIVDSVHAFANNQEQNIYLFLIFCLFATFGFAIFCYRFFCSEFDSNLSGKNKHFCHQNPKQLRIRHLALASHLYKIRHGIPVRKMYNIARQQQKDR